MITKVNVFYEGWGEHWHWGTLAATSEPNTPILFEYTPKALDQGLELSRLHLPLGAGTYSAFPGFQYRLPGVIYDALPDGWGMLLIDRLFRRRGINPATVSILDRLTYIGDSAMGALTFQPEVSITGTEIDDIPLDLLARESQAVLDGQDSELLPQLVEMGGSPQGARPKALIYRCSTTKQTSTLPFTGSQPWLIKFPAKSEHAEVCAIEYLYAACAFQCGIDVPEVEYFDLGTNLSAFGSKRFDRQQQHRIPMHSLAGYIESDFRIPSCDYETFIRTTGHITQGNMPQVHKAFKRSVFNVIFNNRDDHTKNFAYLLNQRRQWELAPAYDLTYNEGPNGHHQLSVMGHTLSIPKSALIALGEAADIPAAEVGRITEQYSAVASQFSALAIQYFDGVIRKTTVRHIQQKLNENIKAASA